MVTDKKKKIKILEKERHVSLNMLVDPKIKEWLTYLGNGSATKGFRLFCDTFIDELQEAAIKAKRYN